MGQHQKHTKLKRPESGRYARNEWGMVGTNCGLIRKIADQLSKELGSWCNVGYMDADHGSSENEIQSPFSMEYTDKISYHRVDMRSDINDFDFKRLFRPLDVLLVNSNHFESQKQIVFIDEKKEKSLLKRIDQLNDIRCIVLKDDIPIYDFLLKLVENRNVPIIRANQIGYLASLIETDLADKHISVKGLVLAGGKSERMGKDKSAIRYFNKPQAVHIFHLLEKMTAECYLSVRDKEQENFGLPFITDQFTGLGPFGAILTAFREDPDSAWLVVACDLPFIEEETFKMLLAERDISKFATAFHNPETGFPDPLITLWEPRSYARILEFLALGYSCPRKVLINSDIFEIEAKGNWLRNVNSPDDYEKAMSILNDQG